MLRRSSLYRIPLHHQQKYPNFVSFHKFPWAVVRPGDSSFFDATAEHYEQLLKLASRTKLQSVFLKDHPAFPEPKWDTMLPGLLYILPTGVPGGGSSGKLSIQEFTEESAMEEANAASGDIPFAPFGWTGNRVSTKNLHALGGIEGGIAQVVAVHSFSSPSLRIFCNAITMQKPQLNPSPMSSLAPFAKDGQQFTLFHFHRPNRSPAELVKPLEKFFVHQPDMSPVSDLLSSGWSPVLEKTNPNKKGPAKAAPMKTSPPKWYMNGLNEKDGIVPGDCFGHRDLQWGSKW